MNNRDEPKPFGTDVLALMLACLCLAFLMQSCAVSIRLSNIEAFVNMSKPKVEPTK